MWAGHAWRKKDTWYFARWNVFNMLGRPTVPDNQVGGTVLYYLLSENYNKIAG